MFTDIKEFYPTPESLINKMISGLDFKLIKSILEPSAGKGNIIDALKKKEKSLTSYYNKFVFDIDCIEIDQNLQHILKGKNYRVVHDNFLTYNTMKEYDLIIMNPPFAEGDKHLLKALEMQKRNGGAIVCLLNAETIKNPCSNIRKDLNRRLEEYNATIEYIQNAFIDAERKTSVEIALIKVKLPDVEKTSFIFDNLKKQERAEETYTDYENTQLINNDFIKSIVNQFNIEVEAGIKLINEYRAMSPKILSEFGEDGQKVAPILKLDLSSNRDSYSSKLSINNYIKDVRSKYWSALFHNEEFIGKLTNNLRQDFYNRIEELKEYDFSLFNIYQIKIDMIQKTVKGIEDTIINLFDELSYQHYYSNEYCKNIHYYNGWKTNKSYYINKKVIIPLNGFDRWGGRYYPTSYDTIRKLEDMEKCLNYLDGGLTDAVDIKESLKFAEDFGETKDITLKYFNVTFYKKGTCHIIFTNEELLKKFNIYGSQKKGWLPPSYGKKKYSDMTTEEKTAVNEFEGEKEYNKVMTNTNYYLFNSNSIVLLEDKTA